MDRFTTKFKALVAFVLIFLAFALLGFNQVLLNKEVHTAVSTSTQAVNISTQTYKDLKALTLTPTASPSAVPTKASSVGAVNKFTPAPSKK